MTSPTVGCACSSAVPLGRAHPSDLHPTRCSISIFVLLQPYSADLFTLSAPTNWTVSQLTVNVLGAIAGTVYALGNTLP